MHITKIEIEGKFCVLLQQKSKNILILLFFLHDNSIQASSGDESSYNI